MNTTVWFNFDRWGLPGWTPVHRFEMDIMLAGAEEMIAENSKETCDWYIRTRNEYLIHEANTSIITEDWVSHAVLLSALEGLMGYRIPDVLELQD
jgi:hypothetical protein